MVVFTVSLMLTCVLMFTQLIITNSMGSTPIEDHLETEIDFRHPSTFKNYTFQTLSVRQLGFKSLKFNASGVIKSNEVTNWETFAMKYWYETRNTAAFCPTVPVGIATQCDWALVVPCLFTSDPYTAPRTIFVHTYMLSHFVESTLYFMDHSYRFVLVSAGTDMTIPRSLDPRFKLLRGFSAAADGGAYYERLLKDERIIHWFAENHDMKHSKLSTLPTGFAFDGVHNIDDFSDHPDRSKILAVEQRPLKFLLSDRVRNGIGQWFDRHEVVKMCIANDTFCHRPVDFDSDNGLPHADFLKMLVEVPFVACVHGGGIDPSPKAWEALLLGTIPIIQHSTLDDAYERFPVMFVTKWTELFDNNTESLLIKWREKLAPYYLEGSYLRKHVLDRLKSSYWIEQFHHKYRDYEENQLVNLHRSNGTTFNTNDNKRLRKR